MWPNFPFPMCFPPPRALRVFTGVLNQMLNISQVSIPVSFPSCLLLFEQTGAGRRDPLSPGHSFGAEPFFGVRCFGVNCVSRLRKQSLVFLLYSALRATVI